MKVRLKKLTIVFTLLMILASSVSFSPEAHAKNKVQQDLGYLLVGIGPFAQFRAVRIGIKDFLEMGLFNGKSGFGFAYMVREDPVMLGLGLQYTRDRTWGPLLSISNEIGERFFRFRVEANMSTSTSWDPIGEIIFAAVVGM